MLECWKKLIELYKINKNASTDESSCTLARFFMLTFWGVAFSHL